LTVIDLRDAAGATRVDPDNASPLFRAALATIAKRGGGEVYVPPGEWTIDEAVQITTPATTLRGAGVRASRLRMRAGAAAHCVIVEVTGVVVERLTVIGNGRSPSSIAGHHGIRVAGHDADWVVLRDLAIQETQAYGIGLEKGSFESVVIENVSISDSGADGIDFKNTTNTGTRCFLRNVTVERPGVSSAGKAGIDVRGRVRLLNIDVLGVKGGTAGIRFRDTDRNGNNGTGGLWSSVDNYYVTTVNGGAEGIQNPRQKGVAIGNGNVVQMLHQHD
jgi:hypothetical protein